MAIVYILTNQSMPDTIKVGITENLDRRIRELDNTSTPLPFECYYAVEVENASVIEKKIHEGLDDKRIRQNREFFNASPEQAKAILEIAEVMGGKNVTPTEDIVETPQDKQALDTARKKRSKFNFGMVNLEHILQGQVRPDRKTCHHQSRRLVSRMQTLPTPLQYFCYTCSKHL